MDGGSSSYDPTNESYVLDVHPLRTLTPIFPGPYGFSGSFPAPNTPPPFPFGNSFGSPPPPPFNPVYTPVFSSFNHAQPRMPAAKQTPQFHTSNGSPAPASAAASAVAVDEVDSEPEELGDTTQPTFSDAPPPQPARAGAYGAQKRESPARIVRKKTTARKSVPVAQLKRFTVSSIGRCTASSIDLYLNDGDDSQDREQKMAYKKQKTPKKGSASVIGENLMSSLAACDDRESVKRVLMIYDGLRRKLSQIDDIKAPTKGPTKRGSTKRPNLKAGSTMMSNGVRVNATRRVGAVAGIDIGDLFFFRFEMCLVGLHAPSMAGIDYMAVKFGIAEDPIALSVVSSGVYEDDNMDDSDVLIYTGQGGTTMPGKQVVNQKLERGNLALERSLQRGNEIRVIRGMKDLANPTGKIYVYDGLYKIQESWTEKGKAGFNVFKFKLVRVPGQPEGSASWKRVQQWKDDPCSRESVILPDISSGVEKFPICVVNEVDREKGPAYFSYSTRVKYSKPVDSSIPLSNCSCENSCDPVGSKCGCKQTNGGLLPYTSMGVLVTRKQLIYECGSCRCSINCRNRVTQKGINLRFEVYKTKDKGWGLRSWDPIRAGYFICEFVGEVSTYDELTDVQYENNYLFDGSACTTEDSFDLNLVNELLGEEKLADSDGSLKPLSIIINARKMGNISRFMNHSCSPNVFWQPVLYDHTDEHYPHIMFYALQHIPPMTELTYDYGSRSSYCRQLDCLCGSSKCRGFFFT